MRRIIAAALMVGFLSACAASGSIQTLSGSAPAVHSAKSGAVEVSTSLPDKSETVAALKAAITAQLVNKRMFKSITDGDSSDYLLRVDITEISEVSQAARVLVGAFAGQAEIAANCTVIDRRDGRVIGKMVAKATSSGGHIFAGTTQEAIDIVALQIVDYLLANRQL